MKIIPPVVSPWGCFRRMHCTAAVYHRLCEWDAGVHTCIGAECFSSRRPKKMSGINDELLAGETAPLLGAQGKWAPLC